MWESFVDNFETFTRDILDDLGKDQLKRIRDYLCENGVYIQKEARKSIADGLLRAIHEPTPSKWPTNNPTPDESTLDKSTLNEPTLDESTLNKSTLDEPTPNKPTPNNPTPNNTTLAQITQAID